MQRFLTAILALCALLLIVSVVRRHQANEARRAAFAAEAETAATDSGPPPMPDATRRAARALLARDAGQTYLDSLLASTDSLVRRWPDRGGPSLRLAILEGGAPDYHPRMAGFVRQAASAWETVGAGLWFTYTRDTAEADIIVSWQKQFGNGNQAGRTDLRWSSAGPVVRAYVSLATRNAGDSLFTDTALLGTAVHELGHAVGMPHSSDSSDVMFPVTRVTELSARDRSTARLLYALPPGSLRDPGPR